MAEGDGAPERAAVDRSRRGRQRGWVRDTKDETLIYLDHGRLRRLGAGVLLGALALLAACSDNDDGGVLSMARAEAIAAEALLDLGDLPDDDWQRSEAQIEFSELIPGGADLDLLPTQCQALEDAIGDLPALLGDVTPLATSNRSFASAGQLLDFRAVSSSVVVFAEPAGAEQAAAIINEAFTPDSLEACITATALPIGGADIQIVDFSLATPAYALADSTALSATIQAVALIIPIELTIDLHAFQRDNALALYVGLELNSSDLAGEHAGLLTTLANRVQEAQN